MAPQRPSAVVLISVPNGSGLRSTKCKSGIAVSDCLRDASKVRRTLLAAPRRHGADIDSSGPSSQPGTTISEGMYSFSLSSGQRQ
eukprot:1963652-Pleurochrysis_carterae.AAC.1